MTMQKIPIVELVPAVIEMRGALDFDKRTYNNKHTGETGTGLSPRRLPDWTRSQVPQVMDVIVRMPSGVRMRFNTDAQQIGLEFLATNLVNPGNERRKIALNLEMMKEPAASELHLATSDKGNAIHLDPAVPGKFELVRGEADTLWFKDLPAGNKCCELWLPHNAFVELRALHLEASATISSPDKDERPRWLHYGSSISHCMEADEPALTWPAVAARSVGVNLQSLGFGGQCHLDQFVARTIRDSDAEVISIKLGINLINMDSMRERVFVPALHGFLDTIREGKPDVPIVLISPIYCPSAETSPGPTLANQSGKFVTEPGLEHLRMGCLTLQRTRTLISQLVSDRQSGGDLALSYLDGLVLFGSEDARDLPDDLHPNPAGYIRMGQRFAPTLGSLVPSS